MKSWARSCALAAMVAGLCPAWAASPVLPFAVNIGGQAAQPFNDAVAMIPDPVAPDAVIEVMTEEPTIVVNAFAADTQGVIASGAQPIILLLQDTRRKRLDQTIGNQTLKPGHYVLNIVAASQGTARVLIEVKATP